MDNHVFYTRIIASARRKLIRSTFIIGSILLSALGATLFAAVPNLINFQGRLTDSAGVPVTTAQTMQFDLFNSASGGVVIFSETQSVTPDSDGIYNVFIGSTAVLGDIFDQDIYIAVTVGGQLLSPRYQLTSSPYARRAAIANDINNDVVTSAKISNGSIQNVDISATAAIQLSKLEKDPSVSGTINLATNPVDWSQLKNVPAGFSDGTDNAGAGSTVVEENDATVEGSATNIDFLGAHFDITSSPAGEANVAWPLPQLHSRGTPLMAPANWSC